MVRRYSFKDCLASPGRVAWRAEAGEALDAHANAQIDFAIMRILDAAIRRAGETAQPASSRRRKPKPPRAEGE